MSGVEDPSPGEAIIVATSKGTHRLRSCTCKASKQKTCHHLKALGGLILKLGPWLAEKTWEERFNASLWCQLARRLFDGDKQPLADVRVQRMRDVNGTERMLATRADNTMLARYLDPTSARLRFLERTGNAPAGCAHRARVLERLALFQATPEEQIFAKMGMKSHRQAWEQSFWHRLAYHCLREYGDSGRFHPAIDQASGDFTLTYEVASDAGAAVPEAPEPGGDHAAGDGRALVQVAVPRTRVKSVLELLRGRFPDQQDLAIHPVPLRSLFQVSQATELDLEVRPMIMALQASGEARLFARDDLARFRYGNLIYIPELELLAELERPGKERKFKAPRQMRLARSQVPSFLDAHAEAIAQGALVLDEPIRDLVLARSFEGMELAPRAADRDGYEVSAFCRVAGKSIPLADVLRGQAADLPYLETEDGWIDLRAPAFARLGEIFAGEGRPRKDRKRTGGRAPAAGDARAPDRVRMSARQLLQLGAGSDQPPALRGRKSKARTAVERILALRPAVPFRQPAGLRSPLRPYQVLGVDWLRFLWENRLAGLLCDDMGLGKTHQAMALMLSLRESEVHAPFLVVCPTSVLSHWRTKIQDHAPGLQARVHHGPQRDAARALDGADVVLTSYGVLRRDIAVLETVPLALAVLDEIQHVKNRATHTYQAAQRLDTQVMIGLTGTPIENSLDDLKSLFDLLLPNYLGSESAFAARFGAGRKVTAGDGDGMRVLRRLTGPFVLRRLKRTVLDELPEKIEDVETCTLSDDQLDLYRKAIDERGKALAERVRTARGRRLPYIHIFALLNLLKQICDHPALALNDLGNAERYTSGKWDLYCELLGQALASGQKAVVFTQYLGMLALMGRHLDTQGVGYVTLSGTSRKRGDLIERFNTDPECRVFLGSLKAGGTGIDLIAGSVVIHYDRWWNAAREDQATDRVYRIGQKRAVQVLKLVTEDTLEEGIAAIIRRKRALMESAIQEDDPTLAKIFTREELLELLRPV